MDAERVDIFMPLYVRDFLASTIGWTAEEIGHYFKLLAIQWDRGDQGLPGDMPALERLSPGVTACWGLLAPKFPLGADGQRRNLRCEHHRAGAVERRRQKSEAGKRGNLAKYGSGSDGSADGSQSDRTAIAEPSQSDRSATDVRSPPHAHAHAHAEEQEGEKNTTCSSSPTRPRGRPSAGTKAAVSWSADAGWQGITDADRSEWAAAYPGAVIDQELAKATAWLRANPKRCGKRNWRRFLVGWLQRCQDKGGTNRTPGERPGVTGPAPVPMDKRRYWRGKAGRSMTDDEYQAWMAAQARDGPTSDGASVGDLLARTLTEGTR